MTEESFGIEAAKIFRFARNNMDESKEMKLCA